MILGTEEILRALDDGRIICDPAPQRVEGAHIDVTIGPHIYRQRWRERPIYLRDADATEDFQYFDFSAPLALMSEPNVVLPRRSFSLAHTNEFIGTAPDSGLVPILHTRSTLARWGLSVHLSAGWGDEGYASRWTLEIINPHDFDIYLPVGARVGCIVFQQVSGAAAAYQPGTRYNVQRSSWTPEAMLPRKGNW